MYASYNKQWLFQRGSALCSLCEIRAECIYILSIIFDLQCSVLWPRRLSPTFHCGGASSVIQSTWSWISVTLLFIWVVCFSPVIIVPPVLHNHLRRNVSLSDWKAGKSKNRQAKHCISGNRKLWDGKLHQRLVFRGLIKFLILLDYIDMISVLLSSHTYSTLVFFLNKKNCMTIIYVLIFIFICTYLSSTIKKTIQNFTF